MFDFQIINEDITKLDADGIFCPVWEDLTPAYEVGEAIFAAAGYENVREAILEQMSKPFVTGSRIPNHRLGTLWILKIQGKGGDRLVKWNIDALDMAVRTKKAKTVAIPMLIDAKETAQIEEQWRSIFRVIIRMKKTTWGVERRRKKAFLRCTGQNDMHGGPTCLEAKTAGTRART